MCIFKCVTFVCIVIPAMKGRHWAAWCLRNAHVIHGSSMGRALTATSGKPFKCDNDRGGWHHEANWRYVLQCPRIDLRRYARRPSDTTNSPVFTNDGNNQEACSGRTTHHTSYGEVKVMKNDPEDNHYNVQYIYKKSSAVSDRRKPFKKRR